MYEGRVSTRLFYFHVFSQKNRQLNIDMKNYRQYIIDTSSTYS